MTDPSTTPKVKEYSPPYLPGVTFTYEDLLDFPEDGKHYEIINGDLFMSPSPVTMHQRTILKLTVLISNFLDTNQIAEIFVAPYDVLLSETDVVQPDIVIVLNENKHIITEKNISGVPDFIIEILSPTNRKYDIKKKRALYERYGVKEYWIVDPDLENIQKFVLNDGSYSNCGMYEENQEIVSDTIKGLSFPIRKIF